MKTKIILGPPGTGKTTELLNIIEGFLDQGINSNDIAFVAFTTKAANEAKQRAKERFSLKNFDLLYFRTLHSLCFHELGLHSKQVVSPGSKHIKAISKLLGWKFTGNLNPEGLDQKTPKADRALHLLNLSKARDVTIREVWDSEGEDLTWHEVKYFKETYEAYNKENDTLDFSDFLLNAMDLEPLNVRYAIIDEVQDLSYLQWKVVFKLFKNCEEIIIAGDDDQSIFGWSGADTNYFLDLKGETKILKQSYRIPEVVFDVSQHIIGNIQVRYDKAFKPTKEKGLVEFYNDPGYLIFDDFPGSWYCLARNKYLLKSFSYNLQSMGKVYTWKDKHSVSPEHAKAIYAWTALKKGNSINKPQAKAVYECLKDCKDIKEKTKYSIHDFVVPHRPYLDKKDWHDALNAIPIFLREYYRAVLRRGGNLVKTPIIHLNSIHGVKGGEADNVALLTDMSFKTFKVYESYPSNEHRVFYTGVTRSKNTLHIINPQTQYSYKI